jgi:hypothetical protein
LNHKVEQQNLDTKLYWTAKSKDFHNQLLHGKKLLVRKYMLYAAADFSVNTIEFYVLASFQYMDNFVKHVGLCRWNIRNLQL